MKLTITRPRKLRSKVGFLLRFNMIATLMICLSPQSGRADSIQKISLSKKHAELTEVMKEVRQQSGYDFLIEGSAAGNAGKISLDLQNATLSEVLDATFHGQPLEYSIAENTIVIRNKVAEPRPIVAASRQQQLQGTVSDEAGEALMGVTVAVKGTTRGATTNEAGAYSLAVNPGEIITFTYVGFVAQEITFTDQKSLDVVMQAEATTMDEVVVVGYGTQRKVNLTGAISSVKAEELDNIAASNLSNTLAGRAPGVNVTNTSGLSGASSSIRIRGSFGEPLYVIDGIVRDKEAFDALEASEVDQMSFLKDAATASIYGSRAGNGVVLVTTRKGSVQKPTFNFQSNYSLSSPTMTLLSDLTDATDELIYQNRVAEFNGTPLPNGEEEFSYFQNRSYNVHDFIWRNPMSHRQSLSVTGGSDKITYYSMLSYRGEQGSYESVDHGKYNLRSNVSAKITDAITVD